MINAPVLHVNGDYPEGELFSYFPCTRYSVLTPAVDVARAVDIAFKYRNHFRKVSRRRLRPLVGLMMPQDIIVDLLVYRRWYDLHVLLPSSL